MKPIGAMIRNCSRNEWAAKVALGDGSVDSREALLAAELHSAEPLQQSIPSNAATSSVPMKQSASAITTATGPSQRVSEAYRLSGSSISRTPEETPEDEEEDAIPNEARCSK
eukprot:5311013-Amphidinium_carterae.1